MMSTLSNYCSTNNTDLVILHCYRIAKYKHLVLLIFCVASFCVITTNNNTLDGRPLFFCTFVLPLVVVICC